MGMAAAISNASPVWRFGNSWEAGGIGFGEQINRCWLNPTVRQITSWALWAADAGVSALLGLRRLHR